MALETSNQKTAWITLLTRASYLPGVITLAHSLATQKTVHPLVVLVTPSVPADCIRALDLQTQRTPLLRIHPISPLRPPSSQTTKLIAERFEDTWTKLRAFELTDYETLVFLDADITIYRNIDPIFSTALPSHDWLAATHACVCNLDHDEWAPSDWHAENCAYTPLRHPTALTSSMAVPLSTDKDGKYTHALLNSGMFLFHPSKSLWDSMLRFFETSTELSTYKFPDQDFLAAYFRDRWMSLGWQYNALKTMRYWHENIWRDEEVCALHYIVDKPWAKRIASDRIAGHLGRDKTTHGWWWRVWDDWRRSVAAGEEMGSGELLSIMDDLVAKPLDSKDNQKQCEENKKNGLPVPVPEHPGQMFGDVPKKRNGNTHTDVNGELEDRAKGFRESIVYGDSKEDDLEFPILRKLAPAEQGHGPVVKY